MENQQAPMVLRKWEHYDGSLYGGIYWKDNFHSATEYIFMQLLNKLDCVFSCSIKGKHGEVMNGIVKVMDKLNDIYVLDDDKTENENRSVRYRYKAQLKN